MLKFSFHILLVSFFVIVIQRSGYSQKNVALYLLEENIESMLPPLETILDSAVANNPSVKFRDLQISINQHKLLSDRTLWTRNVGIQTDVRYGTFDNFSTNTAEGQSPAILATRSSQMNYGVGAYIKLPLYDFINRKNQIELAKDEIEQAENMAEFQRKEIRQLVIRQYNELILKHRVLKIKLKYAETARINMQMVEKEFLNGVIPITEYARQSEAASRTESDFESYRMEFLSAYMIMEEIVGMKFNLTK